MLSQPSVGTASLEILTIWQETWNNAVNMTKTGVRTYLTRELRAQNYIHFRISHLHYQRNPGNLIDSLTLRWRTRLDCLRSRN